MDENEEFEFRLRAEQEAASAGGTAAGAQSDPTVKATAPAAPDLSPQEQFAAEHAAGNTGADALGKAGIDALAGPVELLAQGFSGLLAKAVGGVRGLMAGGGEEGAQKIKDTREALTYEPRTQTAKAVESGLGSATEALGKVVKPVENKLDAINPEIVPAIAAGGEAVTDLAGLGAASGVKSALKSAAKPAEMAEGAIEGSARLTGRGTEAARAAGYKARPSDFQAANPEKKMGGKLQEKLTGTHEAQKGFTVENQTITNRLAAEDMGLKKGERITPEALDEARKPHNAVYDETATKAGKWKTPQDVKPVIDDIIQNGELPKKQRDALSNMRDNMEGQGAIDTVRFLRSKSRAFQRSEDAKTQAIGENMREAADALEKAMDDRLNAVGETDQLGKLKAARTSLAKIHDYQVALKNGQIDAHVLARMDKKSPGRMTGNAAIIANAADSLPGVTGLSTKATGTGSVGVPTSKTGVIDAALGAAGRGVLKLTGQSIDSPKFQNRFGREATGAEATYKPDYAPTFAPPRAAPDPYAADTVDFTPTNGVTPVRSLANEAGLELEGAPVANPQQLPDVPDFMTADTPPPVRYEGGIDFTPSGPSLADTLAGELGLMPSPVQGERFAPIVGRDPSGVPHGDMIDFVTDGMDFAKPNLVDQLGLGSMQQPPAPMPPLSLTAPPGTAPAATNLPGLAQLADQLGLTGMDVPQPVTMELARPPGRVGKAPSKKAVNKSGKD